MSRRRHGFTLVELMVVIMIIVILMGLLIPAVNMARESARRTECLNNLKQIGLAFHSHANALGGFPAARTMGGTGPLADRIQNGWAVDILPYVEQTKMTRMYNFTKSYFDPVNNPVVITPLPLFTCPSTKDKNRLVKLGTGPLPSQIIDPPIFGAAGDYFVRGGSATNSHGFKAKCPLYSDDINPLSDITDGLSYTCLVNEMAGRPHLHIRGVAQYDTTGDPVPNEQPAWSCWAGLNTMTLIPTLSDGVTPGFECIIGCNNARTISSFHPGGANTLVCDGSVRFLAEKRQNVDLIIALHTSDGGENALWP